MKLNIWAVSFDDRYGTHTRAGSLAEINEAVRDWLFDDRIDAERAAKELLDAPDDLDEIDYYDLLNTALDDPDVILDVGDLTEYRYDLFDSVSWDCTTVRMPWTFPFRLIWAALRKKPVDI